MRDVLLFRLCVMQVTYVLCFMCSVIKTLGIEGLVIMNERKL